MHLAHSGIHNNHDRCDRRTSATDIPDGNGAGSTRDPPGSVGQLGQQAGVPKVDVLPEALPPKDSFRQHVSNDGVMGAPGAASALGQKQKHQTDVSGAIAEGPRLTGRRVTPTDKVLLSPGVVDRTPELNQQGLEPADSPRRAARDDKDSTWSQRWRGDGSGSGRGSPRAASGWSDGAEDPADADDGSSGNWQSDELRALREARQAREARR